MIQEAGNVLGLSLLLSWMTLGDAPATVRMVYELGPESSYSEGCVPPCLCPIRRFEEVSGSFAMLPTHTDPLFDYFQVESIGWVVSDGGEPLYQISGIGSYRIGGEVALTQQLQLDLFVNGIERQYDSGLVAGGGDFPVVSIAVAQGNECFDTSFRVVAQPSRSASVSAIPALTSGNLSILMLLVAAAAAWVFVRRSRRSGTKITGSQDKQRGLGPVFVKAEGFR